ncbi:MAG TPA: TIGR01777 family oxidoreductase [Candidatus Paceibacterota bacterium]
MTIVVAGGSGFIGTCLLETLLSEGNTVVVVDRTAPVRTHPKLFFIACDVARQPLPYNILEHTDAVINLIGEPIMGKWTPEKKALIRESRINSTKHIVESIASTKSRPGVFICASATGFYGDTGPEAVDETGAPGTDYLAEVVAQWEAAARTAIEYGVRVVCVRTAPVLGRGGMLASILQTARFGFLLNITKRNPWFSWIHVNDVVGAYRFALQTSTLQGVVNAVSPESIQFQELMKSVSRTAHRPIIGTIPRALLRMLYGSMANEFEKNSQVVPRRLLDKGFVFEYPTLEGALLAILKK